MNYNRYRWCVVSSCTNTSIKNPEKLFIKVPDDIEMRNVWLELAKRDPKSLSTKSRLFLCEDHFNLEQDMENYMEYKIMGSVKHVKMKVNTTPSRFCFNNSEKKCSMATNKSTEMRIKSELLGDGDPIESAYHECIKEEMTNLDLEIQYSKKLTFEIKTEYEDDFQEMNHTQQGTDYIKQEIDTTLQGPENIKQETDNIQWVNDYIKQEYDNTQQETDVIQQENDYIQRGTDNTEQWTDRNKQVIDNARCETGHVKEIPNIQQGMSYRKQGTNNNSQGTDNNKQKTDTAGCKTLACKKLTDMLQPQFVSAVNERNALNVNKLQRKRKRQEEINNKTQKHPTKCLQDLGGYKESSLHRPPTLTSGKTVYKRSLPEKPTEITPTEPGKGFPLIRERRTLIPNSQELEPTKGLQKRLVPISGLRMGLIPPVKPGTNLVQTTDLETRLTPIERKRLPTPIALQKRRALQTEPHTIKPPAVKVRKGLASEDKLRMGLASTNQSQAEKAPTNTYRFPYKPSQDITSRLVNNPEESPPIRVQKGLASTDGVRMGLASTNQSKAEKAPTNTYRFPYKPSQDITSRFVSTPEESLPIRVQKGHASADRLRMGLASTNQSQAVQAPTNAYRFPRKSSQNITSRLVSNPEESPPIRVQKGLASTDDLRMGLASTNQSQAEKAPTNTYRFPYKPSQDITSRFVSTPEESLPIRVQKGHASADRLRMGLASTNQSQIVQSPTNNYRISHKPSQNITSTLINNPEEPPPFRVRMGLASTNQPQFVQSPTNNYRISHKPSQNITSTLVNNPEEPPPFRVQMGLASTNQPQFVQSPTNNYRISHKPSQNITSTLVNNPEEPPPFRVQMGLASTNQPQFVQSPTNNYRISHKPSQNITSTLVNNPEEPPPFRVRMGLASTNQSQVVQVPTNTYRFPHKPSQNITPRFVNPGEPNRVVTTDPIGPVPGTSRNEELDDRLKQGESQPRKIKRPRKKRSGRKKNRGSRVGTYRLKSYKRPDKPKEMSSSVAGFQPATFTFYGS